MFTGLIEEIGKIKSIKNVGRGRELTISAQLVLDDLKIDDSVAINGVCLTVVARNDKFFSVEAVEETLRKTTLSKLHIGQSVNLERALRPIDRMGGHIVQGHIDCTAHILAIEKQALGRLVWFSYPDYFSKYVIPQGSICINGVSLTIAKDDAGKFMVSIIPHTWENTTFKELKAGDEVNLEFDVIGKYVEKLLKYHNPDDSTKNSFLNCYLDQPF